MQMSVLCGGMGWGGWMAGAAAGGAAAGVVWGQLGGQGRPRLQARPTRAPSHSSPTRLPNRGPTPHNRPLHCRDLLLPAGVNAPAAPDAVWGNGVIGARRPSSAAGGGPAGRGGPQGGGPRGAGGRPVIVIADEADPRPVQKGRAGLRPSSPSGQFGPLRPPSPPFRPFRTFPAAFGRPFGGPLRRQPPDGGRTALLGLLLRGVFGARSSSGRRAPPPSVAESRALRVGRRPPGPAGGALAAKMFRRRPWAARRNETYGLEKGN